MTSCILFRIVMIALVLLQIRVTSCDGQGTLLQPVTSGPSSSLERSLTNQIRAASPDKLRRGKIQAARKLQANLARALGAMGNGNSLPPKVRTSMQRIMTAAKRGHLTNAMVECLPNVMTHVPNGAPPATQLQVIVIGMLPHAPAPLKPPLQALLEFVRANLHSVNNILVGTLSGTGYLLQGVVGALAGTLGGVNSAVNISIDSLHNLVGSLLGCSFCSGTGAAAGQRS